MTIDDIIRRFEISDSNYLNHYAATCVEYLNRAQSPSGYTEKHHIFPKSIFGPNKVIVEVSYTEHLRLHWYLWEAYRETRAPSLKNMNYAFFSFVRHNTYRKEFMSGINDQEASVIFDLLEVAKLANVRTGEDNPFYGKTHSPETIAKILETKKANGSSLWVNQDRKNTQHTKPSGTVRSFNPGSGVHSITLPQDVPDGNILGTHLTDFQRLKRSLKTREVLSAMESFPWIKTGVDHFAYGTVYMNNGVDCRRVRKCDVAKYERDGYVHGILFKEECGLENRNKKIGDAHRGRSHSWQYKINQNPDKIKKTADKNRGSRRTASQKQSISDAVRKAYNEGGLVNHAIGKKWFFNPENEAENGMFIDCPRGWVSGNPNNRKLAFHDPVTMKRQRFGANDIVPDGWLRGYGKRSIVGGGE